DGDALAADLAERARVIRVVAHQGRHVEVHREPGLALGDQVAEPGVGVGAGAVAGDLSHRPEPAAVHRGVGPAREGILAGQTDRLVRRVGDVLRGVDALSRDARRRPVAGARLWLALEERPELGAFPRLPQPADPLDSLTVVQ